MNRWLAKWGVKLASEKKERELAKKWSAGDIEVEAIPFSFSTSNGEELRAAPCVYTQDLVQRILSYLDELEESVLNTICTYIQYAFAYLAHTACSQVLQLPSHRAEALTWHDDAIPKDEIWVKMGGDKGGGSFKMSFKVMQ